MRMTVIGATGSYPGPRSPASCYLLQAEHEGRTWSLAMDLGPGSLGALQRHVDPMRLDAVLLSHLHPDHCLDLTGLYVYRSHHPAGRASGRLPVHAPPGADERMGRAYGVERAGDVTDAYDFVDLRDGVSLEVGPFTVTPYAVRHVVTTFGFRVVCGGRTLSYTADTDTCEALTPLLTGADLALAEASFVEGRDSARGIHLTGRRAAEAAVAAGDVHRLMLTHIPAWNDPEVGRAEAAAVWPGEVELAEPDRCYEV